MHTTELAAQLGWQHPSVGAVIRRLRLPVVTHQVQRLSATRFAASRLLPYPDAGFSTPTHGTLDFRVRLTIRHRVRAGSAPFFAVQTQSRCGRKQFMRQIALALWASELALMLWNAERPVRACIPKERRCRAGRYVADLYVTHHTSRRTFRCTTPGHPVRRSWCPRQRAE